MCARRSMLAVLFTAVVVGFPAAAAAVLETGSKPPLVQLNGRFHPGPGASQLASLPQWMSWPASSATVTFSGSASVAVVLDGTPANFPAGDEWITQLRSAYPGARFQIDLDGKMQAVVEVRRSSPVRTWRKTGLTAGRHTLRVTMTGEARYGAVWLKNITLAPAGRFFPPPATPGTLSNRSILFVGDSLTAGAGNIGHLDCSTLWMAMQDAQRAYAPVAARALRADWQVLGWSGATVGIYRRRQDGWTEQQDRLYQPRMRDLFRRADALGPASTYNYSTFVPQVVVLAAGINDFDEVSLSSTFKVMSGPLGKLPTLQVWLQEYEALVREVRAAYPEAAIVQLTWPFEMALVDIRTWQQQLAYQQWIAAAVSHFAQAGISKFHSLQVDGNGFASTNYCKGHPDVATHTQVAAQLASFIQKTVPGF